MDILLCYLVVLNGQLFCLFPATCSVFQTLYIKVQRRFTGRPPECILHLAAVQLPFWVWISWTIYKDDLVSSALMAGEVRCYLNL